MGHCQSQESFGFEIVGSLPPWKPTPFNVRGDTNSTVLSVARRTQWNPDSDSDYYKWDWLLLWTEHGGLGTAVWKMTFSVYSNKGRVVIAKSSWESLTQRHGLRNDKSEKPPIPWKPWIVNRKYHGEQQLGGAGAREGSWGIPAAAAFHLLENSKSNESQSEHRSAKMAWLWPGSPRAQMTKSVPSMFTCSPGQPEWPQKQGSREMGCPVAQPHWLQNPAGIG